MRKQIFLLSLAMILPATASARPARQNALVINGQVLDADGRPVPGAVVYAYPDGPLSGRLPSSSSDKYGKFAIAAPRAGGYAVVASKLADGYPSAMSSFYNPSAESLTQVDVREDRPAPFVTVRFGPKAGQVAGHVRDAETNQSVEDVRISLCRAEAPKYCHRLSGKHPGGRFQILVPPAPFTIQISAPGYEDWYGGEEAGRQPEPLRVASGATKNLNVSLRKSSGHGGDVPEALVLDAPLTLAPANGMEFDHYPRVTRLEWSAVPGAASYTVEVDFCRPSGADRKACADPQPLQSRPHPPMSGIEGTSYEFNFVGKQPGRWRVWAVDTRGRAGAKSAWGEFVYQQ